MGKSRQHIIKEIAQDIDCGFDCYYNSKTNEIVSIPNFSDIGDEADFKDAFGAELEEVRKHGSDYIKIEALQSFDSFKIMERFAEQLTDKKLQSKLESVLANKKPFQNFKHKVDHSDFRQHWFDFKKNELENIVETVLNNG